jgi:hypothetical protein
MLSFFITERLTHLYQAQQTTTKTSFLRQAIVKTLQSSTSNLLNKICKRTLLDPKKTLSQLPKSLSFLSTQKLDPQIDHHLSKKQNIQRKHHHQLPVTNQCKEHVPNDDP